jgi:pSer/pThr/pTyr-binding forkhead associated (FHA) protein
LQSEGQNIGVVCGQCDHWSPLGASVCPECSNELTLFSPPRTSTPPPPVAGRSAEARAHEPAVATGPSVTSVTPITIAPAATAGATRPGPAPDGASVAKAPGQDGVTSMGHPSPAKPAGRPSLDGKPARAAGRSGAYSFAAAKSEFADLSQEELMEQARNYVCRSCSSGVPTGHKFCGRCGSGVPIEILNAQTLFFGDMQNPAKAKLILIRGEGMDGLSFHLKAEQHIVGRNGQLVFPDDPFVSPKHANFFYRDGKLVVRDEGSLNGVYIRVRGTVDIAAGDTFLAGEQLFRLDPMPRASDGQDPDGTYFYSSPKHPSPFRLTQILQGGAIGMTVCARGTSLQIGREGGDLNFPMDLYMSGSHCRIEEHGGKFTLTDLNSRNGTYVRIKSERDLAHGDYLFIGRKLLRVELNTN